MLWEASVLDPNEVRTFTLLLPPPGPLVYCIALHPSNLIFVYRASASTAFLSQTAKKCCHLRQVGRRSSPRACSGSCSRARSPPKRRRENFPASLRRRESCRLRLQSSLMRAFPHFLYLSKKAKLMLCTLKLFRFPSTLHPMTQLSMGVAALNSTSQFAAAYEAGMKKSEYWKPALEDSIALIARLPALAARIYRNVYKDRSAVPGINKDLDLVGTLRSFQLR